MWFSTIISGTQCSTSRLCVLRRIRGGNDSIEHYSFKEWGWSAKLKDLLLALKVDWQIGYDNDSEMQTDYEFMTSNSNDPERMPFAK